MAGDSLLLTCEHGGNQVPERFRSCLAPWAALLDSHRGYDPGAAELAERLARRLGRPLVISRMTRLLVDLNRSPGHRELFSVATRGLTVDLRDHILRHYYRPYRRQVQALIEREIDAGSRVLHLSVHTFTPVLAGRTRNADLGLLYDPGRKGERVFARQWREALGRWIPGLRVRFNYPYRGTADGLTTALRRRFPDEGYVGLELEVNQHFPLHPEADWERLQEALRQSLEELLVARPA